MCPSSLRAGPLYCTHLAYHGRGVYDPSDTSLRLTDTVSRTSTHRVGPTLKARFAVSHGLRGTRIKRESRVSRGAVRCESRDSQGKRAQSKLRVGIVGGSIAGMVAARALLDSGVDVEVFERHERRQHANSPGCLMLQNNALRVLELLSTESTTASVRHGRDLGKEMNQAGSRISSGAFFSETGEFLWQTLKEQRPVGQDDIGVCITRDTLYEELESALPDGVVRWGVGVDTWVDQPEGQV